MAAQLPTSTDLNEAMASFDLNSTSSRAQNETIANQNDSSLQLEFITSLGPPIKAREDAASNRLVRIQAMRSFLHQKTSPSTSALNTNSGIQREGTDAFMGKFKLASWSRKGSKGKRHKTNESVDGKYKPITPTVPRDLGPLNALKIPLSLHTRLLLHHCKPNWDTLSVWNSSRSLILFL